MLFVGSALMKWDHTERHKVHLISSICTWWITEWMKELHDTFTIMKKDKWHETRNHASSHLYTMFYLSVSVLRSLKIKCNDHVPNMRSWGTSCGLLRSTTCTWCRTTRWCTGLPCTREEQKCSMWPDNWLQQRSAVCTGALLLYIFLCIYAC